MARAERVEGSERVDRIVGRGRPGKSEVEVWMGAQRVAAKDGRKRGMFEGSDACAVGSGMAGYLSGTVYYDDGRARRHVRVYLRDRPDYVGFRFVMGQDVEREVVGDGWLLGMWTPLKLGKAGR